MLYLVLGAVMEEPMNQGLQVRVNHENRKNEISTPSQVRKKGINFDYGGQRDFTR